ncbi:hypothetical protein CVV43_05370, partial [Candidatus Saccharibacteria bacterium HGW-Saccharibacteria-1]
TIKAIAVGQSHTLALDTDGNVYAWGYNASGQLGLGNNLSQIEPKLVNTASYIGVGNEVKNIVAGASYSVVLTANGKIYSWGDNNYGQLGNNSTTVSNVPVAAYASGVLNDKMIKSVSAQGYHTVALGTDGQIYSWGYNAYGELGNNTNTNSSVPVVIYSSGVLSGDNIISISTGNYHTLALGESGRVYSWGRNNSGQLGDNTLINNLIPVEVYRSGVLDGKKITKISSGSNHSLALDSNGELYSWGLNTYGQLGDSTVTTRQIPVKVDQSGVLSGKIVNSMSAGGNYSVATSYSGTVYTWGANNYGQLAKGDTANTNIPGVISAIPIPFSLAVDGIITPIYERTKNSLSFITPAHAPGKVGLSLTSSQVDGLEISDAFTYLDAPQINSVSPSSGYNIGGDTIIISGSNFRNSATVRFGYLKASNVQVIDSSTISVTSPATTQIGIVDVEVTNDDGQSATLSDGFNYNKSAPVIGSIAPGFGPALGGTNVVLAGSGFTYYLQFKSVQSGATHSCGLTGQSKIYCWGSNTYGQLGDGTNNGANSPRLIKMDGVLAGKKIIAISVNGNSSYALDSEGKIYSWGYNASGQLGNNSTTNSTIPVQVADSGVLSGIVVKSISAGDGFVLALGSDNKIYSWGLNSYGQLGDNSTANRLAPVQVYSSGIILNKNITEISAGGTHSLALDYDGKVYSWGRNNYGQIGDNTSTNKLVPTAVDATSAIYNKTITSIAAGYSHNLIIDEKGSLYSWGYNANGQLGNNSTANSFVPVNVYSSGVLNGVTIKKLFAGDNHTVVISADEKLYGWGLNTSNQLGDGTAANKTTPVALSTSGLLSGKEVVSVSARNHTLVTDSSSHIYGWGVGTSGQLGDGTYVSKSTPVMLKDELNMPLTVTIGGNLANIVSQSTNQLTFTTPAHEAGFVDLKLESAISDSYYNESAYEYLNPPIYTDVSPNVGNNVGGDTITVYGDYFRPNSKVYFGNVEATVVQSNKNSLVVTSPAYVGNGEVNIKILNDDGQSTMVKKVFRFTFAEPTITSLTPQEGPIRGGNFISINGSNLIGDTTFKQIASGAEHSCGLTKQGLIYCWGNNSYGQLGNASSTVSTKPVQVDTSGVLQNKSIVKIAVGGYSGTYGVSVAIDSNGKVYSWGYNGYGQLGNGTTTSSNVPVEVNSIGTLSGKAIKDISAGPFHVTALSTENKLYSWGYNAQGQLGNNSTTNSSLPVAVLSTGALLNKNITKVKSSSHYTVALDSDGKAYAWGYNAFGQLGDNSTTNRLAPVAVNVAGVLAGKNLVDIAAENHDSGYGHTLAADSDGAVYAWGYNGYGQLGNNSTANSLVPVTVTNTGALSGRKIVSVAAASNAGSVGHSLAMDDNGDVYGWGYNGYGQLGTKNYNNSSVPVQFNTDNLYVKEISAGGYTSSILTSTGEVLSLGYNAQGQFGDNSTTSLATLKTLNRTNLINESVLNDINVGGNVAKIKSGLDAAITVIAPAHNPGVVSVGYSLNDNSAELGDKYTYKAPPEIYSVAPSSGFVSGGETVYLSGDNFTNNTTVTFNNQILVPEFINKNTLKINTPAAQVARAINISAMDEYSQVGQILFAYTYIRPAPAIENITLNQGPVAGKQNVTVSGSNFFDGTVAFKQISNSTNHSCGLTTLGRAYCWGDNTYGQLGNGLNIQSLKPVLVNMDGVLKGKTIVRISAGGYSNIGTTLAVDSDGKVYAWGYNGYGELGDNTTLSSNIPVAVDSSGVLNGVNIIDVAAGATHSVALSSTGQLYSWGYNGYGQLGDSSSISKSTPVLVTNSGALAGKSISKVKATFNYTMALDSDGKLYSWGVNSYGQLGDNSVATRLAPVPVYTSGVMINKQIVDFAIENYSTAGHSLAVDSNGAVYAWGYNGYGQIGNGTMTNSSIPILLTNTGALLDRKIVSVAAGSISSGTGYSLALDNLGKVYAWGYNGYGQFGNTLTANSSVPIKSSTGSLFIESIAAAGATSAILADDGNTRFFGYNSTGLFGNNSLSASYAPVATAVVHEYPTVQIDNTDLANINYVNSSTITAKTLAHEAGVEDVKVINSDNQSNILSDSYTFKLAPEITSISPSVGLVTGSDTATIIGNNFTNNTTVSVGGILSPVAFIDEHTILVTIPQSTFPGYVDVATTDEFGESGTLEKSYLYKLIKPTIKTVSPNKGAMMGGTPITITGTDFLVKEDAGSWYKVLINGVEATDVRVVSPATMVAKTPKNSTGLVDLEITSEFTDSTKSNDAYTYNPDKYEFKSTPCTDYKANIDGINCTLMANQPGLFEIQAKNELGELVTSPNDIQLILSTTGENGSFGRSNAVDSKGLPVINWGVTTVTIPAGKNSVRIWYKSGDADNPIINVKDLAETSVSKNIQIDSKYKILVTGITDPTDVGTPSSVTIQATDYTGKPLSDYRGTIHFVSTDGLIAAATPSPTASPLKHMVFGM